MNEKDKIAVVGMGDAFSRYYEEVLFSTYSNNSNFEIYCADKTIKKEGIKTQEDIEKLNRLQDKIKEILKRKNFYFVDVANLDDRRVNEPEPFSDWVINKKFGLILIGTPDKYHVQNVLEWIQSSFSIILVEKPFSDKPNKISELLKYPDKNKTEKVMGFSHVRAKIHENFKDPSFQTNIIFDTIGKLSKFRFFYLEDYSGTDEKYINKSIEEGKKINPDRNCPVLIPGRIDALEKGIVFDLGIHMLSVLKYFGKTETFDIEKIWAGKYLGVDYEQKELDIENETFAAIDFKFANFRGEIIEGQTFLGKGILGIEKNNDFGLHLDKSELGEVKLFELEGDHGKKIQFFFTRRRKSDKNEMLRVIINGKPLEYKYHKVKFTLKEKPYMYIFEKALEEVKGILPDENEENLFFPIKTAQLHLEVLKEIRGKIDVGVAKLDKKYPNYHLGNREGGKYGGKVTKRCEPLHEIMDRFEPIWKKTKS